MRRIPPSTHPEVAAQAEQTLATAARRLDPTALACIGERLLAHLDPDGTAPAEEPEQARELRVRTGPDGIVSSPGSWTPKAAPGPPGEKSRPGAGSLELPQQPSPTDRRGRRHAQPRPPYLRKLIGRPATTLAEALEVAMRV